MKGLAALSQARSWEPTAVLLVSNVIPGGTCQRLSLQRKRKAGRDPRLMARSLSEPRPWNPPDRRDTSAGAGRTQKPALCTLPQTASHYTKQKDRNGQHDASDAAAMAWPSQHHSKMQHVTGLLHFLEKPIT